MPVTIAPMDTPNKIPRAPATGNSLTIDNTNFANGKSFSLAINPLKTKRKTTVEIAKMIAIPLCLFWKSLKQAIERLKQSNANKLDSIEKITVDDRFKKNELFWPNIKPVKTTHKKPMIRTELYMFARAPENILFQCTEIKFMIAIINATDPIIMTIFNKLLFKLVRSGIGKRIPKSTINPETIATNIEGIDFIKYRLILKDLKI